MFNNVKMLSAHEETTFTSLFERKEQEIRDIFRRFDLDKDGKLHPCELRFAIESMGLVVSEGEVQERLSYLEEKNIKVTVNEFEDIVAQLMTNRSPRDDALSLFKIFDVDGTGKISLANLEQISCEAGENISKEELNAMVEEFDKDGDGQINQEEFVSILLGDDHGS